MAEQVRNNVVVVDILVRGILSGHDAVLNVVLSSAVDTTSSTAPRPVGTVVVRGTSLVVIHPDGASACQEIQNPFIET